MSGRPGNPNMIKGAPSTNAAGRGGRPVISAARSLAIACQEAASDEEIAEWLLEIASGRWPHIRGKKPESPSETPIKLDTNVAPSGEQRMQALKEFLLRRDGQPMQAVVLKADIEARARRIENASDAIEVEAFDANSAGVLEAALWRALGGGVAAVLPAAANTAPAIDVESVEVESK